MIYDISCKTLTDSNLVGQKRSIRLIFSHYFAKIKVDSYYSFPIEKILTLHNFIIHIKSILNKDKNHNYYKKFLERCSYQLAKKIITKHFFYSIIMAKFGKTKIAKENFYAAKNL